MLYSLILASVLIHLDRIVIFRALSNNEKSIIPSPPSFLPFVIVVFFKFLIFAFPDIIIYYFVDFSSKTRRSVQYAANKR